MSLSGGLSLRPCQPEVARPAQGVCLSTPSCRHSAPLVRAPRSVGAAPRPAAGRPSGRTALRVVAAVKQSGSRSIVCSKTLVAAPGQEERVKALCDEVAAFSQQAIKQRDSGVLEFNCSQDMYEPNVFHLWERYDCNASMGKHNTTDQVKAFMEEVQQYLEGPVGMALYEWKDGQLGHARVQGGPRGEGGLDDATGASGAAGGASMKQTSGVVDLTRVDEEDDKGIWNLGKIKLPWQD